MRVLSLFVVDWVSGVFWGSSAVDSPRQSTVYNRYATLFFANLVFPGFPRYANVNFGSQRDNKQNIGNPCKHWLYRGFFLTPIYHLVFIWCLFC